MKMKIIKLLIIVVIIITVKSERDKTTTGTETKRNEEYYGNNNEGDQYVAPHIRRGGERGMHNLESVLSEPKIVPTLRGPMPGQGPHMPHRMGMSSQLGMMARMMPRMPMGMPMGMMDGCPCASEVRCRPCAALAGPNMEQNPFPMPSVMSIDCPCAPKPHCPVCPPLSLLHEIASKKALQDQQLAVNLKSISGRMAKYFDMVIKYAGDVVKFEKDAKEAAKKMEEASMKAQLSRKNMFTTSEKARFIAKAGIVENRPCGGIACNLNPSANPPGMFGYFPEKVFPEEVENIKEYMSGAFTTNVNGFVDENGNDTSRYERDTNGMISVQPVDVDENKEDEKEQKKKPGKKQPAPMSNNNNHSMRKMRRR